MSYQENEYTRASSSGIEESSSYMKRCEESSDTGKSINSHQSQDQDLDNLAKSPYIDFEQALAGNLDKSLTLNVSRKNTLQSFNNENDFSRSRSMLDESSVNTTKWPLWVAILFINLYCMCYVTFSSCIKVMTATYNINTSEILFVRGLVCMLMFGFITRVYNQPIVSPTSKKNLKWLLSRAICPIINIAASVVALQYIPVFIFAVLFQTLPFWSSLFGFFLLGEKITLSEVVGIVVCFSTIILLAVTQSESDESSATTLTDESSTGYAIGVIFALVVAAGSSANGGFARKMRQVHFSVQLFFLGAMGFAFGVFMLSCKAIAGGPALPQTWKTYGILAGVSSIEAIGLIFMTLGYQNGNLSLLSLCANSTIIYGFIADVLVFNQTLSPLEGLGAFIIVITIIIVGTNKAQQVQQMQK